MHKKIAIIGAGIGGLTTALALQKIGLEPVVYERAAAIKPVGAGIIMANNAMQVYKELGILHAIQNRGHKISQIQITDEVLQQLSDIALEEFESKYGVYNLAIHRAALLDVLAQEVGFNNIKCSKSLLRIQKQNKGYILFFEDGTEAYCEVLIAADGIHSVVREQLFSSSVIRDSGQRCWRGICKMPKNSVFNNKAIELWSKGKRFGFSKIDDQTCYWFAVVNATLQNQEKDIKDIFKDFHPEIKNLIADTPEENIIFNTIIDLKPIKKWTGNNLCLIGDAAHATTPNLGQGACQAVEDAYVLMQLLEKEEDFNTAFQKYEKLRIKKAHFVVETSWKIGKMAQIENRFFILARNAVLPFIPNSIKRKQLEKVFNINKVD